MKYQTVAVKLTRLGCVEIPRHDGGSHRKWHNPANNRITVVPDWGKKELKIGTIRAVVRQRGLDWDDFKNA